MDKESTVFISYSSKDLDVVNRIADELEKMEIKFWKAPEMIAAGSSYAREIPKAIRECNIFLLILSRYSQESIWVEKEIDSAICQRKVILPIQIDGCELNDTFRFYLNNVQIITYYQDSEKAMKSLWKELKPQKAAKEKVTEGELEKVDKEKVTELKSEKKAQVREMANVESTKRNRGDSNALRMNRIPLSCQYCGCKVLEHISMGTYRCTRCDKDNYDDFQNIRNFLHERGPTSAVVIEKETGVPRRIIEYFFREEYLEIPQNSPDRVPCQKCGAPIRTGTLCESCKSSAVAGERLSRKDMWHSFKKKKIGD